ncbi:hypothetical protein MKX01_037003 [Papaver californicum]|nr:hypothetical protein MKX01_037003 [Papaver californicum]
MGFPFYIVYMEFQCVEASKKHESHRFGLKVSKENVKNDLPDMVAVKDADFSTVDAVFCCLPHGTTQEIIKGLPKNLKIVDLSAKEAVYGLTEVYRKEIQDARLVADPGCYPTSIQLPLIPLMKANLIGLRNMIIDAKSGVSGAGRAAKEANLYTEISEDFYSYGVTKHSHVPEIEQGLSEASKSKVTVSFSPSLAPMDEQFIRLIKEGEAPKTHYVSACNACLLNVFEDRIAGRAIIISAIDNLMKGASGQALQNLNLMMGFPENTGIPLVGVFP